MGRTFEHEEAIEDHWMNVTNNYDVRIRDYCRLTLYLGKKALRINILLKIVQKYMEEFLDPLFNRDKIVSNLL